MKSRLVKKVLVVCAALMTLSPVMGDEFKNSVVNMKFTKDAAGNLRVNVVTAKPYNNPVLVNRKEDNRYVILLPETSNSMSGKPVIDNVAGTVSGVTIRTQPYSASGCKGYTKITIISAHPIRVSAHASVPIGSAPVQVAKTKTTKTQPAKTVVKTTQTVAKATSTQTVKTTQIATKATPAQPTKPQSIAKSTLVQTTNSMQTQQKAIPVQSANAIQTTPKIAKTVEKKPTVQTQKQILPKTTSNIEDKKIKKSENTVVAQVKPVAKTNTVTKSHIEDDFDAIPQPNILIKEQKQMAEELKQEKEIKSDIESSNKNSNKSNVDFDIIKFLMVLSAIGLPILAIIFILSMNKKIKQKMQEATVVQETPSTENTFDSATELNENQDLTEPIDLLKEENEVLSDDEDNTFANLINKEPEQLETIESMPLEQDIDELLETDVHQELSENDEETIEENIIDEDKSDDMGEASIEDEILDEIELEEVTQELEEGQVSADIEDIEPIVVVSEDNESENLSEDYNQENEQDEVYTADTNIVADDFEKDSENNIEDTNSEPIEMKIESEYLNDNEYDIEPTNDGIVDNSVQDISFEEKALDEVLEQDITKEETLDDDSKTVIEPVDDIVEQDESETIEELEEKVSDDENISINEVNESVQEEYVPDGFINDFEQDIEDDSIFEELRADTLDFTEQEQEEEPIEIIEDAQDDEVFEELRDEYVTVDGLTVLSKADLSETSGFYLVNFENFSSLIGYINEEIFVLKTFDEFVNNEIYVKVAEQLSDKIFRYIVKIGLYKMVIEVTDKKMSHLIDL